MTFAIVGSERAPGSLDRRLVVETSPSSADATAPDLVRLFGLQRLPEKRLECRWHCSAGGELFCTWEHDIAPVARVCDTGSFPAFRYVHHIEGRLRLKAEGRRPDSAALDALCARLGSVSGVRSATPNCVIGSVTVEYDPALLPPAALYAALQQFGLTITGDPPVDRSPALAERWAGKLVQDFLGRLLAALIAAVV